MLGRTINSSENLGQAYEHLNQYVIIRTVVDHYPANYVVEATNKKTNEAWFLALRRGEFSAQKDKAVSDVLRKYIPNTPRTVIVQDAQDFYLASTKVLNLVNSIDEAQENFIPVNFGSINVLSHLLGESDIHSGQILISSKDGQNFSAHKIDNAESLDEKALKAAKLAGDSAEDDNDATSSEFLSFSLEDVLDNHWHFPPAITNHYQYKLEQQTMLEALRQTPFDEIAAILRPSLIASPCEEVITFTQKMLTSGFIKDEADQKKLEHWLSTQEGLSSIADQKTILTLLEKRHQRYKALK